jgi:hypothetical protein
MVVDGDQCASCGKAVECGFHSEGYGRTSRDGDFLMLDILMVIIALALFALTVGYAHACDRL